MDNWAPGVDGPTSYRRVGGCHRHRANRACPHLRRGGEGGAGLRGGGGAGGRGGGGHGSCPRRGTHGSYLCLPFLKLKAISNFFFFQRIEEPFSRRELMCSQREEAFSVRVEPCTVRVKGFMVREEGCTRREEGCTRRVKGFMVRVKGFMVRVKGFTRSKNGPRTRVEGCAPAFSGRGGGGRGVDELLGRGEPGNENKSVTNVRTGLNVPSAIVEIKCVPPPVGSPLV